MSFDWDKYKGGGNYISAAEKKVLAENGIPFKVTGVREVFKFDNDNFELSVILPDPETGNDADEERTLSFPIGSGAESRDSMLKGLKAYLDDGGEPVVAKVTKVGRAYFLNPA